MGLMVGTPAGIRIALALPVAVLVVVFGLRAPRAVLVCLVVWFVALGTTRRLVSGVSAKETYGDPLLLVGTVAWTILAVVAIRRGALQSRDRLTTAVLILAGLLGVSALNPLQGGLAVGLSGALAVVVPMAAFLVGRSLVDGKLLRRLLGLVAWLGLVVAAYGLYQTFVGFPPWDERWVAEQGYTALNVNGVTRAFASFSAAADYASFLGMAVVVWVAQARGLARSSGCLAALALLGSALWYESARGTIVLTVVAVSFVVAARAGLTLGRSLLFGAAVLLALPVVIGRLAPAQFSDEAGDQLAKHQIEGLTDPFGEKSTLPLHIDLVSGGITAALDDPLGVGVGAVSIGGAKYGGANVGSAEADPANVAIAAGFPGLIAYLAVVVLGVPRLYRQAARRRDPLSLAALGMVIVTSLHWLNGGLYATGFWPWLILGWSVARTASEGPQPKEVGSPEMMNA